jgi:hypothetical protein
MFSWLRKRAERAANPLTQHFNRMHEEQAAAVRKLLQEGISYEDATWGTLKIMFKFSADFIPDNRVESVEREIATLKELGVIAPLAAILVYDKDWTDDNGPSWTYLQEVAREGGMALFDLVSVPTPMVSATQMELLRKVCLILEMAKVDPSDAARRVISDLQAYVQRLSQI